MDYEKTAKDLSWLLWGEEFNLPVTINNRLSRTLGRFRHTKTRPVDIELSKYLIDAYNSEQVIDVLKHELCHWYIFKNFGEEPAKDGHRVFETELKRIGSSSTKTIQYNGSYTEILCCSCNKLVNMIPTLKANRYVKNKRLITTCCKSELKTGKTGDKHSLLSKK